MTTDPVRTDRIMARYWKAIPDYERADIEARVPDGWWITLTIGEPSDEGIGTIRLINPDGIAIGGARGRISVAAIRSLLRDCDFCHRVPPIAYGLYTVVRWRDGSMSRVCDDCRAKGDEGPEDDAA